MQQIIERKCNNVREGLGQRLGPIYPHNTAALSAADFTSTIAARLEAV